MSKTDKAYTRTFLSSTLSYGFIALLLVGCSFLTNKNTASSYTVQSTNKQPATNEIHGIVSPLHMIDAHIGWTQSWYSVGDTIHNDILRTIDGGVHWRVMFTCLPVSSDGGKAAGFVTCNTDFRSSMIASVLEPQANNQTRIYHTSDGGQTWLGSSIDARSFNQSSPVFVDALHGWFFGTDTFPGRDPSSSYIGQNIVLFRTNDGGKTWNKIASSPAISQLPVSSDDAYGTQPPFTADARMTFLNTTTGWLIGMISQADSTSTPWLYVTHDAGTTWHKVALTFPAQALVLWVPQFFDTDNGLLPIMVSGPAPAYVHQTSIYTTHDAGTTWTQSAFVPFDVTNAVFRSMESASADAEDGKKFFYTTTDGWKHWIKHTATTPFTQLYGFTFVSSTLGWAIGENRGMGLPEPGGGRRAGDIMSIQHTTDGGHTWHEIAHSKV